MNRNLDKSERESLGRTGKVAQPLSSVRQVSAIWVTVYLTQRDNRFTLAQVPKSLTTISERRTCVDAQIKLLTHKNQTNRRSLFAGTVTGVGERWAYLVEILSWAIVVAIAFGFLSLAYNSLQTIASSEDFGITKMWVAFAALTLLARLIVWGIQTHRNVGFRIVGGLVFCGAVLYGTIEAVRYIDRRHVRWTRQHSPALPPRPLQSKTADTPRDDAKDKSSPNLIDRGPRIHRAHQDLWTSVLVEGANTSQYAFDPDWELFSIEICNEFRVSPKTVPVSHLTAEIIYTFPDGTNFKLNRGAWLGAANRIGFNVNDYGDLVIVGSLRRLPHEARIFVKEYPSVGPNSTIHLDEIMVTLPPDHDYPVEIRLISESEGEHYATFNYMLTIATTKEDRLSVDLVKASEWDAFQRDRASEPKSEKDSA